jgi:hypothetical protein
MKIKIIGRETLVLSPGEVYDMPDNIAAQIVRRGRAQEYKEESASKKKKE